MFYWALQSSINGQGRQKLGERSIAQRAADYPLRNISEVGGGQSIRLVRIGEIHHKVMAVRTDNQPKFMAMIIIWYRHSKVGRQSNGDSWKYFVRYRRKIRNKNFVKLSDCWYRWNKNFFHCHVHGIYFSVFTYLENAMQYGRYHSLQAMNWLI